ncbi:MAG: Cell shape-determining protein MreC [Candidatus Uhrbacteria bacterium GW2011_GWD2_52_7]|uniref:Cell shape-determining protein MreC n=1 Tax=Candidatus Uhrbacteria bacterium GW2011_GWD2_52_7 TaxID=1618989 RepID=A0A0G1XC17_9BACT|nr:MAG: Cell shape-determining protein MreC [Candidatus Uhrbacteria bacterium GW2011_GWD2_52_7]
MGNARFFRSFSLLSILLVIVVVLHLVGALRFVERPIVRVLSKGSEALYTIGVRENDETILKTMSGVELREAYISLQDIYTKNIVERSELLQLQQENENLKGQLQFFSEKSWTYYTGRVTGKHIDPFESTVLLFFEKAEDTIPLGSPVVTDQGIFVGTVTAVEENIVSVRLLDDGRTKVGAALLNEERTVGVAEGGFGKSIRMNFIPQNEKVVSGDIVVTSGLTPEIPYGLPIGTIEAIEKEPYEPFQSAVVSPLASPNTLQILSIIVDISHA